ncbi:MAG: hypothetical protein COW29_11165 [Rhodobacterales bacterium CG15_BIG_FIL_POST_REV_8_21_14_020_59_13]|nr:MAG: hypothetical protein COW29_11165 [Rhodobacterales bacterium CG15_BIG_FIL_POST_REV_8_21_14_020_59_13]
MRFIRRVFAAILSVGLFVFLTYVFTLFMHPQGRNGWVAALIFIGISAIGCILLYAWLAKPGRKIRLDPGMDTKDAGSLGLGLTGLGAAERRRDDTDPDDSGGRGRQDRDGEENSDDADDDLTGLS